MLRPLFNLCSMVLYALCFLVFIPDLFGETPVDFSREVLPILSDRCFHCHGPDGSHRKAKLRLDLEDEAKRVLKAGDSEKSELWHRIIAEDPDELMPPPDSHRKPLSKTERGVIKRWIEEGAPWGKHWAFEKPTRPNIPGDDKESKEKLHPIDAFVRARLTSAGMSPAPRAELHTRARRVSFDLTGLPPEAADLQATNWTALVDRKLASPHYGERLAMWWLDAARYSDTDGYQQDSERTNWPWRDWVVSAFNSNMPYDQFTIEQFAGDLLPDATEEQQLATCFHRNHMTNGEGGRHKEESRIDYVIDRVNTSGTVWLGLTLGCVQCHDHKFDPVSQRDYYSLFAFFNSIDETGAAGTKANPYLEYTSPLANRAVKEAEAFRDVCKPILNEARSKVDAAFADWLAETRKSLDSDYKAWRRLVPAELRSSEGTTFNIEDDGTVQTTGPNPRQDDYRFRFTLPKEMTRISGWKLDVLPHESHTKGGLARGETGRFILTNVKLLVRKKGASQVQDIEMRTAVADLEVKAEGQIYGKVKETLDDDPRKGWTTWDKEPEKPHTAVFEVRTPLELEPDDEVTIVLLHRSTYGAANIGRFAISVTDQRGEAVRGLKMAPLEELAGVPADDEVPAALKGRLLSQYHLDQAAYQAEQEIYNTANLQVSNTKKAAGKLKVQVLTEKEKPRDTHILERGVWDAKGDKVAAAVLPAVLPWPADKAKTRLDLANWIVAPENPLTARVTVNHLWQMMFGAGLVRTPEDFGLQGEVPTHPDLLDWLAVELVESGWDLKHILRLIVTSETYQQQSHVSSELLERDPQNRLLARAPRFRLPAWMIRDNALQVSGLLNPALGGPPVRPWQPDGVWREIFMGRFTYQPSRGPAQYRRTLYAYWRRSSAPTFLFDSAQRRVCEVGVRRTNTPLHALALLNDTTMLEASRALAEHAASKPDAGLGVLAKRVLYRSLDPDEAKVLEHERDKARTYFNEHPEAATAFLTVGQQRAPKVERAPELAAWMVVASMMINLDEAMTHE